MWYNMGKVISEVKEYYVCIRCNVTTATEHRLCPCNRKVCDAKKMGTIAITKTITLDNEDNVINRDDSIDDIEQMMASMNL
jgi:hypothetical protein